MSCRDRERFFVFLFFWSRVKRSAASEQTETDRKTCSRRADNSTDGNRRKNERKRGNETKEETDQLIEQSTCNAGQKKIKEEKKKSMNETTREKEKNERKETCGNEC